MVLADQYLAENGFRSASMVSDTGFFKILRESGTAVA